MYFFLVSFECQPNFTSLVCSLEIGKNEKNYRKTSGRFKEYEWMQLIYIIYIWLFLFATKKSELFVRNKKWKRSRALNMEWDLSSGF